MIDEAPHGVQKCSITENSSASASAVAAVPMDTSLTTPTDFDLAVFKQCW
jgi:hypothetical protein